MKTNAYTLCKVVQRFTKRLEVVASCRSRGRQRRATLLRRYRRDTAARCLLRTYLREELERYQTERLTVLFKPTRNAWLKEKPAKAFLKQM